MLYSLLILEFGHLIFLFSYFQAGVKSFFKSTEDMRKHSQVAFFLSELISDPFLVGYYVFDKLKQNALNRPDKRLVEAIFHEAGLGVPKSLFHNQWINHYNHRNDDEMKRPRDTMAVQIPSKLYLFDEIKEKVGEVEERKGNEETRSCEIRVYQPDASAAKNLLQIVCRISQLQSVTDLHLDWVECHYLQEPVLLNLSKFAQSVILQYCSLPPETLNHLIEQVSQCTTVHKIDLQSTELPDVSSLTLSNKPSLTYLDLKFTRMSQALVQDVCLQIKHLIHLEYLGLSGNNLSSIPALHFRNSKSLRHLDLNRTRMSLDVCKQVIREMNNLAHLENLNLSGNELSDCLQYFLPHSHPGMPSLEMLQLNEAALGSKDLKHLSNLLQSSKMPQLRRLYLDKALSLVSEEDVAQLIETCVNESKSYFSLSLMDNNLSSTFKERWKQRCSRTHVRVYFDSSDRRHYGNTSTDNKVSIHFLLKNLVYEEIMILSKFANFFRYNSKTEIFFFQPPKQRPQGKNKTLIFSLISKHSSLVKQMHKGKETIQYFC